MLIFFCIWWKRSAKLLLLVINFRLWCFWILHFQICLKWRGGVLGGGTVPLFKIVNIALQMRKIHFVEDHTANQPVSLQNFLPRFSLCSSSLAKALPYFIKLDRETLQDENVYVHLISECRSVFLQARTLERDYPLDSQRKALKHRKKFYISCL